MRLRFLLAMLLLAACSTAAMGRPSNRNDKPLQSQTFLADFGNESEGPFELALLLGAMTFPVILICSYELFRPLSVRKPAPSGSYLPLGAANPR
jgi:hypothetical protein